ncbi:hypothetical protein EKO27_g10589 [Xylaria grammica]|uniref:Uncharacterized protein n=1 Tax=Xylaria grammica TaxID=363999 RepID=A0A439CQT3_9PEZI|nr:hypothetical protein EKO27_g10589 [Xylaria grammica]
MAEGDPSISNYVQGLAFFGTPFQGTESRKLSDILKSIAERYGLPNNDFAKEIQTLEALSKDLSTRHTSTKLRFFGERESGAIIKLVNKEAAKITGISNNTVGVIGEDHDNICKFKSKEPWYGNVIDELRTLAEVETINTAPTVRILARNLEKSLLTMP